MAVFKEAVESRIGISKGRIALIVCAILLCAAFFTCAGTNDDAYAGDYVIKVNRQQNVATVYAKDSKGSYTVPVRTMLCITGADNSTPLGTYRISNQYRWKIMIGGVWSQYASRFNGEILLHSITYYDAYDKSTMKVARYNRLGTQMSLGCTNLAFVDAKWIYKNCDPGTKVIVYASSNPGPWGKPPLVKIGSVNNRNWDPSDDDSKNPWRKNIKGVQITTPAGKKLMVGQTLQMAGDYKKSGSIKMTKGMLKWYSTNRSVADISFTGKVTAKKPGTTYIVLKDISETWSATYKLTVTTKTKSVSMTVPSRMIQGTTGTAKAKPNPAGSIAKWTSSNTAVATVDSKGRIKAVGPGTATITAYSKASTSEGGTAKSASGKVTVLLPKVVFQDSDKSTIRTQNVPYGKMSISYPSNPKNKTVDGNEYAFVGWYKIYNPTTMTLTCRASYKPVTTETLSDDSTHENVPTYSLTGAPKPDLGVPAGKLSEVSKPRTLAGARPTLWGLTAYETCMDSVTKQYSYANHAIVVSGNAGQDACVAAGYSSFDNAPVILCDPKSLSWETFWTLLVLDTTEITIIGGPSALSDTVKTSLEKVTADNCDMGQTGKVNRLYGQSAADTANSVYEDKKGKWGKIAVVCTSKSPYDAISGSPYAAAEKAPIFLTDAKGNLSSATLGNLRSGGFSWYVIFGGTSVVSQGAQDALGSRTSRIWGKDRYSTSFAVAKWTINHSKKLSWNNVGFATGKNFKDALAGGVAQGHCGGIMILIEDSATGLRSQSTYKEMKPAKTVFYGGPSALPYSLKSKFAY